MNSETTNNNNNNNDNNMISNASSSNNATIIEQRMTALYVLAGGGTKPFWNITTTNQKEKYNDRENGNNNYNCEMNQQNVVNINISNFQLTRIIVYILIILTCCNVLLYPSYRSTDFDVHRHWKALTYNIPIIHWYSNNTYVPVTTKLSSDRMKYNNINNKYNIKPIKTVETVHTLDYPPGFALLEYMMVHNFIVQSLIYPSMSNTKSTKTNNIIINHDQCLYIMDDTTIYNTTGTTQQHEMITQKCIAYMRTTVIIFADLIYWFGSFCISFSLLYNNNTNIISKDGSNTITTKSSSLSLYHFVIVFLLLIFHPTMIWLDHIHFQYNGTMLGLLLLSISCLLYANNTKYSQHQQIKTSSIVKTTTISTTMRLQKVLFNEHTYHIIAIMIFGIVLTLKHLYITNSLWFIVYILRRYCCTTTIHTVSNTTDSKVTTHHNNNINNNDINNCTNNSTNVKFTWYRLIIIILMGSLTVLLPFIPFFIAIYNDTIQNNNNNDNTTIPTEFVQQLQQWFLQVASRLFPFQRGLVHTYWAGNVWAIYITMYKICNTILQKLIPFHSSIATIQSIFQYIVPSPQFITPRISLYGMIVGQIPGLILVYKAAQIQSNQLVLQSFIIVSLGTFLFQYHAHEKAIVTSLLPCIVWYASIVYNNNENNNNINTSNHIRQRTDNNTNNCATTTDTTTTSATMNDVQEQSTTISRMIKIEKAKCIVFDMNAYSILSLYPLIYPTQELLLKVSCTVLYMSFLSLWLYSNNDTTDRNTDNNKMTMPTLRTRNNYMNKLIIFIQTWYTVIIMIVTIIQYEIPYIWLWGKYEFIPLGITSIVCSIGYISIYIRFILF